MSGFSKYKHIQTRGAGFWVLFLYVIDVASIHFVVYLFEVCIHTLQEFQALVLSELSTVAGGPAMWEMLRVAQRVFERNRELMLKNIQECIVVHDQPSVKNEVYYNKMLHWSQLKMLSSFSVNPNSVRVTAACHF